MAQKALLKDYSYCTKNPMTVCHASLLNAVTALTGTVVHKQMTDHTETLSKKTKTDELLGEIFILKRDANWVKKMFMGANGINVNVVPLKKTREPKNETKPKPKPKPKAKKNNDKKEK